MRTHKMLHEWLVNGTLIVLCLTLVFFIVAPTACLHTLATLVHHTFLE